MGIKEHPHAAAITRFAPAKLNLFLHITGRLPSGYHTLQSLFMLIDWADTLHFEIQSNGQLTREDLINTTGQPLPSLDLSLKAAVALQNYANCPDLGVHIGMEKRIPAQAGMGGGSSDAATTLMALNELWQLSLSVGELAEIAVQLGADVPFFLHQSHAWVEGIGEKITPLALPPALQKRQFLVIKPPTGVATPSVFSDPTLVRDTKTATIMGFAAQTELYDQLQCLDLFGCNDLQPVAQALCPDILDASNWLISLGLQPRMTGSGSAVFAMLPPSFDLSLAPSPPSGCQIRLCSNDLNSIYAP
jgi:4-diphosphocytidyl-2-C-methyl-D-erythritol kinase